jgi:hypothetical protein
VIGPEATVNVLYLTSDLFFSTRVTSVASNTGVVVQVVGSVNQLRDRLASVPTAAVLVDLEHFEADPAAIMALIGTALSPPTTIAYGPHVKEPLLTAARQAGFNLVLSRGQFDQQVGKLLLKLLHGDSPLDVSP